MKPRQAQTPTGLAESRHWARPLEDNSKGRPSFYTVHRKHGEAQGGTTFIVVHLSADDYSISLALEKWVSNEMGIRVIPSELSEPSGAEAPSETWKKMAPHIYWYAY